MFSSKSSNGSRPHASFLLPSFPNLFRGRKAAASAASAKTTATAAAPAAPAPMESQRHANRSSVASTASSASSVASAVTSASTQTTTLPSLSTSPTSTISTSPGSMPASPVAGRSIPLSLLDRGTYAGGDAQPLQPAFATVMTDEPTEFGDDPLSAMHARRASSSGPKAPPGQLALPAAAALLDAVSSATSADPPSRHLQRVLPSTLRCRRCSADLAFAAQVVSKGFTGRHGRALLVSPPATCADHLFGPETQVSSSNVRDHNRLREHNNLANITVGRAENRHLVTGAHVVADIACAVCQARLGWKYVDARDVAQRYKIGKFILEKSRIATFHGWEDAADAAAAYGDGGGDEGDAVADPVRTVRHLMAGRPRPPVAADSSLDPASIEFDSEDEDECEDIFAGVWDAEVVAKRRSEKASKAP